MASSVARRIEAAAAGTSPARINMVPADCSSSMRLRTTSGPEQGSIIAHERERLSWALGKLNDLEREIVLLRHMERMSVAELAQVFKLPESTVKSKHFRALKKLRNLLGKAQESDRW